MDIPDRETAPGDNTGDRHLRRQGDSSVASDSHWGPLPEGYTLLEVLRRDEQTQVVRALYRGDERLLRMDASSGLEARAELAVLAAVDHPGIAPVLDHGSLGSSLDRDVGLFVARAWIPGQDLLAWSKGKTSEEIGACVLRTLPALAHLHERGFVHGDLKPENIVVTEGGEPILVDFGFGHRVGFAGSNTGASGTLFSIAPDLISGLQPSPASDLFALGVLLHRLFVGHRRSARDFYTEFPKRSFLDAIGSSPEELPEWSRDLIVSLTARETGRRPRSVAEFARVLGTRLGLSVETESKSPALRWKALQAREHWISAHIAALGGGDSDLTWWKLPENEDPLDLWELLRLQLTLSGIANRGLRLHQSLNTLTRRLDLEGWARKVLDEGGLLVVTAGEGSLGPWEQHALDVLARATRVQSDPQGVDGGARPRLLIVSPFSPDENSGQRESSEIRSGVESEGPIPWVVQEVPELTKQDIMTFLASRFGAGDPKDLARLGCALAEQAAGSASTLDAILLELQARKIIVPEGAAFGLRLGEFSDLSRQKKSNEPRQHLRSDQAREVLGTLEALAVPLGLGELAGQMNIAAQDLAKPLAILSRGGWIEHRRSAGRSRIRPKYRPSDPLLGRAEAQETHERRAQELARSNADPHLVRLHELIAAFLGDDEDRKRQATRTMVAELEALRHRGCAALVLDSVTRIEETLGLFGIEVKTVLPAIRAEHASAWCSLGRPNTADHIAATLEAGEDGSNRGLVELLKARIATARGELDGALSHYREAAVLDPELTCETLAGRIQITHSMGRDDDVLTLAAELRASKALEDQLFPQRRLTIFSVAAMSAFRAGDVQSANSQTLQLLAEARALGDSETEASLHINRATIERRTGSTSTAQEELRIAIALYGQNGSSQGLAHAQEQLGDLLREVGAMGEAEEHLHSAWTTRELLGDLEGAATVRAALGFVAYDRGHARAGIETLEAALGSMGRVRSKRTGPLINSKIQALLGRIGAASAIEERGPQDPHDEADPRIMLELARSDWCLSKLEPAAVYLRRAAALAASLGQHQLAAEAQLLLQVLTRDKTAFSVSEQQLASLGPLAEQDARILLFVLSRSSLDTSSLEQADALASVLEASGRDDRAARVLLALASRIEDPRRSEVYRQRANTVLEAACAGLTAEETAAFRRHLLGFPDPYPGDLMSNTSTDHSAEELDMDVTNLLEINKRLLQQEDLNTLLGTIVESALAVTGAERGFLVLEEHGVLRFDTALDSSRGDIQRPELEVSRSVVREALDQMKPICVSNAVDDPMLGRTTSVVSLELRSVLCVPISIDSALRGALYLDHRLRRGAFNERAEGLCSMLASQAALAIQQIKRLEEIRSLNRELEQRVFQRDTDLASTRRALEESRRGELPASELIGSSDVMVALRKLVMRVAQSDLAILVSGASGTGKELVARALHDHSSRSSGPFISENCAAIPASLIESEIFGYVRGAFTGAERDRAGLFEQSDGGTLFLDEIGEMPLELQAKLLRVLETGELRRLGASESIAVSFRVVVATNRDLETEIQSGGFRKDLYYRIDGLRIDLPALSQHMEDIPELVEHFLGMDAKATGTAPVKMSKAVLVKLMGRPWPGNVRELRSEVARLRVLSEGAIDDPGLVRAPATSSFPQEEGAVTLAELERRAITGALERAGGDKAKAAAALGISRAKIYQRLKEWKAD